MSVFPKSPLSAMLTRVRRHARVWAALSTIWGGTVAVTNALFGELSRDSQLPVRGRFLRDRAGAVGRYDGGW